MTVVAFDTLKFVEKLEAGGFTPQQAKATTQAFVEASNEQFITKSDLRDAFEPIKSDIGTLKADNMIIKWMLGFVLAAIMAVFYLLLKAH
jgi:hypothetical protein